MLMLDRALKYASAGWPVFPIAPGDKVPLIRSAHPPGFDCRGECGAHGHGLYDATTDATTIRNWWGDDGEPGANVGLRAGVRWWVLDVDAKPPKKGGITGYEMLALLEEIHGTLPETLTIKTPGGGEHRFFLLPEDRIIPSKARIKAPDGRTSALDVRGVGGYVVGEPSVVGGKSYSLAIKSRLVLAPGWLLDVVAPPKVEPKAVPKAVPVSMEATGTRYGSAAVANACRSILTAGEGGRHQAIFAASAALGELIAGRAVGLSAAACEEALLSAALAAGRSHKEAVRTIRDGLNKGAQNPKVPELRAKQFSASLSAARPAPSGDDGPYPESESGPDSSEDECPPPPEDDGREPPPIRDAATEAIGDRPELVINRDRLKVLVQAWGIVNAVNDPPVVYLQQGAMVDVFSADDKPTTIRVLEPVHVSGHLVRVARCYTRKVTRDKIVMLAADPPLGLVNDMHAKPSDRLPVLDAIVRAPVFAAGGRLVRMLGYDAAARLFYAPPAGFEVPPIDPRPLAEDVELAKALLFDPDDGWLGEFPFATPSDKAHAAALLFLPAVRRLINGPTPMHLFEASERGTGKTLLAELLTCLFLGEFPGAAELSLVDEEVRKRLTSAFIARKPVLFFDNLEGRIDAPALCIAITSTRWEDRILGLSMEASLPISTIFVASGNNCELSTDMARRVIRCRLDRRSERPWDHAIRRRDVRSWTMENRGLLVAAVLTLVQSWVAAGCPDSGAQPLGSFESWSRVIGGILHHVGIPGFLSNAKEMYDLADPVHLEWRGLVLEWWAAHGTTAVTASVLAKLADEHELLTTVLASATGDRAKASRIGRGLGKQKGRIFSGLRVESQVDGSQTMYKLSVADMQSAPATGSSRPASQAAG